MRIIGCDLHARQQTFAMHETTTGEVVNLTLMHEGNAVREFYSQLPRPVLVGIEATGSMLWFLNLMEELGIECRVGHPATIRAAAPRKQKTDRLDADLILNLLVENRFPAIWLPTKELLDLRALVLHRQSVGAHPNADPKRAAGHCLGQWITTRSESVELRRASEDRLFAVAAPCLVPTEHVAGDVPEDGRGNRKPDATRRGASGPTLRSAAADDASRSGAGDGAGDRRIPGRSEAVRRWQGAGQLRRAHSAGILQRSTAAARWSDQTRESAIAIPVV